MLRNAPNPARRAPALALPALVATGCGDSPRGAPASAAPEVASSGTWPAVTSGWYGAAPSH